MTIQSQKQAFLNGEGDAWFERNYQTDDLQAHHLLSHDPLIPLFQELPLSNGNAVTVLEVGCGQGLRLRKLREAKGWSVIGLDPSTQAIKNLRNSGCDAYVGTAENLPLPDNSVDLLIYGFCLYLCDRNDLFKIAAEANRVLKPQSWLAIVDFWSPSERTNSYRHLEGLKSYKDDLPKMFTWHPSFVVTDHTVRHHSSHGFTDEPDEWVATTLLRRFDPSEAEA